MPLLTGGFMTYIMRTVTAKLVRYAAERNIWSPLFLIPIKAYTVPLTRRKTPAIPNPGVSSGGMGRSSGVRVASIH
jgi:hypothetical protein